MGGKKGGSADQSGMMQALISAQAAQQAYALGKENLDWSKQTWSQEWPYMQDIAQGQIDTQKQLSDFSRDQQSFYEKQYQPQEVALNKMASEWASPQKIALEAGKASASTAEAINAQKQSSQQQLEGFGVNPGATRFDSLNKAMGVQGGAAIAGAGTTAGMATKAMGAQMLGQVVNTGRGFPNAVSTLSGTGTQAGAAGTSGITQGMQTGSNMMTAPSAWWGQGANNMGVYVGAVNGYNQAQVGFAEANAMESAGWGSAIGGIAGMFSPRKMFGGWEEGGPVEAYDDGGDVGASVGVGAVGPPIPGRYFQAGPAMMQPGQPQPPQPANNNQPSPPIPPQNGTPGGIITPQMSPSGGQVPDDVDAKLTVGEFVMPLDVVRFRGKEYFYKEIDKSRQKEAEANARGDIGGEPTTALPSRNPAFVSRPNVMPGQGVIPPRAA